MKEVLKKFCKSINIDCVGIAPIGPYLELERILKDRIENGFDTEFEENNVFKRIDPRLTMEEVQSVVVCLFPYYIGEKAGANLSKYTFSLDYHDIIKEKLTQIGTFLESKITGFHYKAFVDNGPLVDRYLAYLSGLGFYGINSHIITEKYGSYIFIGYILTNYPFQTDKPLERTCVNCGKCITACPGKSILGNFNIDPRTCRSYLTQKKGELSNLEVSVIQTSNKVFGCDICQDVCPHNQRVALTNLEEFKENILYQINNEDIAEISNKEFRRRYGNRAFSWRGRKQLIKNLHICNKLIP